MMKYIYLFKSFYFVLFSLALCISITLISYSADCFEGSYGHEGWAPYQSYSPPSFGMIDYYMHNNPQYFNQLMNTPGADEIIGSNLYHMDRMYGGSYNPYAYSYGYQNNYSYPYGYNFYDPYNYSYISY